LIDHDGTHLGVYNIQDALRAAKEKDLDLVELASNSTPPVCRILDFGKYKYHQSKKSQEAKKHQKIIRVKEIKMRPKIDEHDYQFKSDHVKRFLTQGHRVKVTIMFRGREMAHTHLGQGLLERLASDLAPISVLEQQPRREGRNMYMYLGAKPAVTVTPEKSAPEQHLEEKNA
jgi:translation initiation factor IF-3